MTESIVCDGGEVMAKREQKDTRYGLWTISNAHTSILMYVVVLGCLLLNHFPEVLPKLNVFLGNHLGAHGTYHEPDRQDKSGE
jgi:hypothetical protein